MPNAERKPFVEPTLTEEASLAELTLTSDTSGNPGGHRLTPGADPRYLTPDSLRSLAFRLGAG